MKAKGICEERFYNLLHYECLCGRKKGHKGNHREHGIKPVEKKRNNDMKYFDWASKGFRS